MAVGERDDCGLRCASEGATEVGGWTATQQTPDLHPVNTQHAKEQVRRLSRGLCGRSTGAGCARSDGSGPSRRFSFLAFLAARSASVDVRTLGTTSARHAAFPARIPL